MKKKNIETEDLSPEQIAEAKRRKNALYVIFFTAFLDILGFGIVIPQLGVYSTKFGASGSVIGLLGAMYPTMQFLFAPFWGRLSDRYGRRPVLLSSIFGTALGYIMFALAQSLPLLFISRAIDGITGANISAAQAYVSDVTEPEERSKVFGMFGAIFGIGFVLGPAIGLVLAQLPGDWGSNFGVGCFTAALSFVNWFVALRRLPETLDARTRSENAQRHKETGSTWKLIDVQSFRTALTIPKLNVMMLIMFVATFAFANLQVTYTPFLIVQYIRPSVQKQIFADPAAAAAEARRELADETLSKKIHAPHDTQFSQSMGGDFNPDLPAPQGMSWRRVEQTLVQYRAVDLSNQIFVVIGITAIIVQGGLIELLRKKFREVALVASGVFIMALGMLLVPWPPSFVGQFPVIIIFALGNGLFSPVLSALVSQYSPDAQRGEIFGVYQSMQSLGRIAGPIIGGFVFEVLSHQAPYLVGGLTMLIAFVLALYLKKSDAVVVAETAAS
jgi:multidrug resistance protein